jgi:hypothetical protein
MHHLLLLGLHLINRHLLPRAAVLALVDNLLPAEDFVRVLEVLDGREVVFVLLHCSDPGDVVEGHDLEAEVLVVADLFDFAQEGGQVGRGDVVYVCEEVGGSELGKLVSVR